MSIFHIQSSSGNPISGAFITGKGASGAVWSGKTNSCGDFPAMLSDNPYTVTISAPGFKPRILENAVLGTDCLVVTSALESDRPAPVVQAPLPPFDQSDSDGEVHTTPPPELVIPTGYDPMFLRADFDGINLNPDRWGGLQYFKDTFKQGANTTPYTMLMSPMLPMYPRKLQDAWLTESAERNYSHVIIAADGWNMPENRFSLTPNQLVQWARYVQSWGNYIVYWGRLVQNDEYLQALAAANAIDFHIVGEEVDSKVTAQQYEAILDNALGIYSGPTGAHFTSNYPEGFPRDTFFDGRSMKGWNDYDGKVHLMWQANQNDSAGKQGAMLYYARQRVALGLAGGNGQLALNSRVYAYEIQATAELYGQFTEEQGCLRTLELLYTTRDDNRIPAVSGFGNGCRLATGDPI